MINFKWRHFEKDIILMSIRWYVAYSLSYRDIEELMNERGISVDHTTVNRWVMTYSEKLESIFQSRHKKTPGRSWRMDETYLKIKGKWSYLYRAVDKEGATVDFFLSEKRDKKAAKLFFEKAMSYSGKPKKVTIDKSGSNQSALVAINNELPENKEIEVRQIKYLNNRVEQDHRSVKRITDPMMGFKAFHSAKATLAGIEPNFITC